MWYLTSEKDNRLIYIFASDNQIVIGRSVDDQVCNSAIPDDLPINGKHTTLTIKDNNLLLQDLGSRPHRYGTFINAEKVEANTHIILNENDIIKFGITNSVWKVNVVNLITSTSTLKAEDLQNLRLTLSKIGGKLKGDLDDTCMYLTIPVIILTIKVVLALIQGSNIVTIDFWKKCLENVNNLKALPDPREYLPKVDEPLLKTAVVSFLPDSRRKTIFQGKKFIFLSRSQYMRFKTVIIKSGALPMLLSECSMTYSMLCAEDIIVVRYYTVSVEIQETEKHQKTISDIVSYLNNNGKRVVSQGEIGLAILYCSLDKFCNPNLSFTCSVNTQTSALIKVSKVLAHESQEPQLQQQNAYIKQTTINKSLISEDNSDKLSNKRNLSEFTSEVQGNVNEKLAATCFTANMKDETSKRRLTGNDDESSINPIKIVAVDKQNNRQMPQNPSKQSVNENSNTSDIFNFDQTKNDDQTESNISKQNLFNKKKKDEDYNTELICTKKHDAILKEDISAMRGSKLKELMEHNLSFNSNTIDTIKKEKLEVKMNKPDLCNTIVTICKDLIVKRQPHETKAENTFNNKSLKNFKKFKKVWPVNRHSPIIHSVTTCNDLFVKTQPHALMEHNLSFNSNTCHLINTFKKEKSKELEAKINKPDLCNNIVTICKDLIVKRRPHEIVAENSFSNTSVNN